MSKPRCGDERIWADSPGVWAIQKWGTITDGPKGSKKTKPGWKGILWYPTLKSACARAAERWASQALLSGEAATVLEACEVASERLREAVDSLQAIQAQGH